jgi:hypothetical protein
MSLRLKYTHVDLRYADGTEVAAIFDHDGSATIPRDGTVTHVRLRPGGKWHHIGEDREGKPLPVEPRDNGEAI